VTNEQYAKFIKADGYRNPEFWKAYGCREWREKNEITQPNSWEKNQNKLKHPVVGVSWYEANAYAKWAGKQLPSEIQWEKAARGPDGHKYPWGDEWDEKKCNTSESGRGETTEVDQYKKGVSPYGCDDMAGNVWEWCREWHSGNNDKSQLADMFEGPTEGSFRVMRGGSCYIDSRLCRTAYRDRNVPGDQSFSSLGFRCVALP